MSSENGGCGKTWMTIRKRILHRDGYICQECGRFLSDSPTGEENTATVHHIKPRAEGGSDSPDNLISLCYKCHDEKHPMHGVGRKAGSEPTKDDKPPTSSTPKVDKPRTESNMLWVREYSCEDVLAVVRALDGATSGDVVAELGCSRDTANRRLRELLERGDVSKREIAGAYFYTVEE